MKHEHRNNQFLKEIQVRTNLNHLITHIQYPIQLVVAHTIHRYQGLTLDFLAFDPNRIHHHGVTYTTLFHVREKENLYLVAPLVDANLKVDKSLSNKMQHLKTIA
jgi:hypothetical protein